MRDRWDVLQLWEYAEKHILGVGSYRTHFEFPEYQDHTRLYPTKGYKCPKCGTGFCCEGNNRENDNKFSMAKLIECPFCGTEFKHEEEEKMIKPTVGRVVWYKDGRTDGPCAAIVARVWSDHCVNLMVIDPSGNTFGATSVPLVQENEEAPGFPFCEWMPYQKGQAAKTEELEKKVAEAGDVKS